MYILCLEVFKLRFCLRSKEKNVFPPKNKTSPTVHSKIHLQNATFVLENLGKIERKKWTRKLR